MNAQEAKRRRAALVDFSNALGALVNVSVVRSNPYGFEPYLGPKPGREAEWREKVAAVDLVATKAAYAFQATGVGLNWKPPGYPPGTSFPVNPASEWGTLVGDDPKFELGLLQQTINMAIGALDALVEEEQHRQAAPRRTKTPDTHTATPSWIASPYVRAAFTVIGLIVAGLIVAYAAFTFGWVGSGSDTKPTVPATMTTIPHR